MTRRVLLLVVALFGGTNVTLADIMVTSALRTISAESTGGVPMVFGGSTTDFGFHNGGALSDGVLPGGTARAFASFFSTLPNPTGQGLFGHEEVGAVIETTLDGPYSAVADSLIDVRFVVTADQAYSLEVFNHWEGIRAPMTGFASVQLSDETNSSLLALVHSEVSAPGPGFDTDGLSTSLPLNTSVTYRLLAHTKVSAAGEISGTFRADAFSTFTLTAVPEPSTATMLLAGLLILFTFSNRVQDSI